MSLIILKNTDSQPPNKFGNDFVNTITIKKNSEVALHSISFNRVDGYSVNDYFFYIYHGPELDTDSEPKKSHQYLILIILWHTETVSHRMSKILREIQSLTALY